jgi:hypothetical protein
MGVAVVLAGGSSGTATAKPATHKPGLAPRKTVKPPSAVAHATGHKIA